MGHPEFKVHDAAKTLPTALSLTAVTFCKKDQGMHVWLAKP
jgi:hypothetical protein